MRTGFFIFSLRLWSNKSPLFIIRISFWKFVTALFEFLQARRCLNSITNNNRPSEFNWACLFISRPSKLVISDYDICIFTRVGVTSTNHSFGDFCDYIIVSQVLLGVICSILAQSITIESSWHYIVLILIKFTHCAHLKLKLTFIICSNKLLSAIPAHSWNDSIPLIILPPENNADFH